MFSFRLCRENFFYYCIHVSQRLSMIYIFSKKYVVESVESLGSSYESRDSGANFHSYRIVSFVRFSNNPLHSQLSSIRREKNTETVFRSQPQRLRRRRGSMHRHAKRVRDQSSCDKCFEGGDEFPKRNGAPYIFGTPSAEVI
jgi:hypothetical protein